MDEKNSLKKQVMSGLIWKFGERIIAQGISFVISILLARILMPEQYGTIALLLVFINLANVFVTNGLGESLIQKRDSGDTEFSTIFYCSLAMSVVLYLIMFFLARPIALFYDNEELVVLIRVLSLQIPLSSVKTIQHAYVSKHMMFKKFFFSTLGGTVVSGVIGIIMAYNGFGAWALVEQYLVNSVIDMTVLFFTVPWRPKWLFNKKAAKQLFGFGWKIMLSQFINVLYTELRSLIIGKVYTSAQLAYYNRGNHFPSLIINNINTSISNVLFPAMSNVNNKIENVKNLTRKSMKMSSYIIFPLMTGMMAVAEPMVKVLLTDKWLFCVPYLQLCCIFWMFQPLQTANVQAIKAVGRSDICLKLEIIKKIIGFGMLFASIPFGVFVMVVSNTLFGMISMLINIRPNKKLINYGYKEQFLDLLPSFLLSAFMGGAVYLISFIPMHKLATLIIQIVAGIVLYVAGSYLFKIDSFTYLLGFFKKRKGKGAKQK